MEFEVYDVDGVGKILNHTKFCCDFMNDMETYLEYEVYEKHIGIWCDEPINNWLYINFCPNCGEKVVIKTRPHVKV